MTALKIADLQRDAREEWISLGIERGREEGISLGREEGISIGIEQGAYEKAVETAEAFLAEGLDPAIVARCTRLPLETIQELIKTSQSIKLE